MLTGPGQTPDVESVWPHADPVVMSKAKAMRAGIIASSSESRHRTTMHETAGHQSAPMSVGPRKTVQTPPSPHHAEQAARSLFESQDVSLAPETEIAYTEAEIAAAQLDDVGGTYRDPFEDARRRAIRRETYARSSINDAGDTLTVKTEVVTFKRDRSSGLPITYEVFDDWIRDTPSWSRDAALAAGRVDPRYLGDWVDARPPPNTSRSPLVWVSASAAVAYCESFGLALNSDAEVEPPLKWELRLREGRPVRVNAKGKSVPVDRADAWGDTGFRCGP